MREVAEALGISHRRVHESLEEGGVRRWRRRRGQEPAGRRVCSFCGLARVQVNVLVPVPAPEGKKLPTICDECLGLCGEILSEPVRQRRSHQIWCRGNPQTVIPLHTGDIPAGTLRSIERDLERCLGPTWPTQ